MCGLTGIYAFNEIGRFNIINLQRAVDGLSHRGPDAQGSYLHNKTGLGHRRLSVIDLSSDANQPMHDQSERYWIVYNGEIYNYKSIREELQNAGMQFRTQSDTEVVLNAYIRDGIKCLDKFNGFFAFAIYDQQLNELIMARDRFGIKPMYYYADDDKLIFASELRSIISFGVDMSLNFESLYFYLQLNYIPAPFSIINGVHKLLPGHYLIAKNKQIETFKWYTLNSPDPQLQNNATDYHIRIRELLEHSVQRRLVSDVPVGTFLSGGIDSSIITGLASGFTEKLSTFSIGYRDEPFFDETKYSRLVAKHFNTNHTEFSLTNKDLYENLFNVLDHFDEPFADSSALPVYILSRETRKHVTVALSGDGADELFAGYNKHAAFFRSFYPGFNERLTYAFRGAWKILPSSRNNTFGNFIRQLNKFSDGFPLPVPERYWLWCTLNSEDEVRKLITPEHFASIDLQNITSFRTEWMAGLSDMESVLSADLRFMLPNDMLFKVDFMSMAHGLEVRVPFLDHELVEYVSGIPATFKITRNRKKVLLKDIFSDFLPKTVLERPKKGFEVPLLKWLRTDLKSLVDDQLLNDSFIREQGIFNPETISVYKKRLNSRSPGDIHAHIWALIVFQWWWKKYFN